MRKLRHIEVNYPGSYLYIMLRFESRQSGSDLYFNYDTTLPQIKLNGLCGASSISFSVGVISPTSERSKNWLLGDKNVLHFLYKAQIFMQYINRYRVYL